jgi:hypothetical protein
MMDLRGCGGLGIPDEIGGRHPSGAEAHADPMALEARLNSLVKKSNIEAEFLKTSLRG